MSVMGSKLNKVSSQAEILVAIYFHESRRHFRVPTENDESTCRARLGRLHLYKDLRFCVFDSEIHIFITTLEKSSNFKLSEGQSWS